MFYNAIVGYFETLILVKSLNLLFVIAFDVFNW